MDEEISAIPSSYETFNIFGTPDDETEGKRELML